MSRIKNLFKKYKTYCIAIGISITAGLVLLALPVKMRESILDVILQREPQKISVEKVKTLISQEISECGMDLNKYNYKVKDIPKDNYLGMLESIPSFSVKVEWFENYNKIQTGYYKFEHPYTEEDFNNFYVMYYYVLNESADEFGKRVQYFEDGCPQF